MKLNTMKKLTLCLATAIILIPAFSFANATMNPPKEIVAQPSKIVSAKKIHIPIQSKGPEKVEPLSIDTKSTTSMPKSTLQITSKEPEKEVYSDLKVETKLNPVVDVTYMAFALHLGESPEGHSNAIEVIGGGSANLKTHELYDIPTNDINWYMLKYTGEKWICYGFILDEGMTREDVEICGEYNYFDQPQGVDIIALCDWEEDNGGTL